MYDRINRDSLMCSCIDDIISTAKKVSNTVTTVKTTVKDVNKRIDEIENRAKVIADAAKDMKGANIGEIINNTRKILNESSGIISTTTGAANTIGSGIGDIANNVQDMGKSVAQQQELQKRRNRGESTNKINAALSGQEWDSSTKGVENVDGKYAGKKTAAKTIGDALNNLNKKSQDLNKSAQKGLGTAAKINTDVDNFLGKGKNKGSSGSGKSSGSSGSNNNGGSSTNDGGSSGSG